MKTLIRNEFSKLKRDRTPWFPLILALLPVVTGTAACIIGGKGNAEEMIFFVNNQFVMFFPMAVFMLAGSLVCREWRDGTCLVWMSYGIAKSRIILAKMFVGVALTTAIAAAEFGALGLLCAFLPHGLATWVAFAPGFALEALSIIVVGTCASTLVASLSRSTVAVSVLGIAYGFVSCLFIGTAWGCLMPGSFAYRIAMACLDPSTYYDAPMEATVAGAAASAIWCAALFLAAMLVFQRQRGVEE